MHLRAAGRLFLSYLVLIALLVAALSFGADSILRTHLVRTVERDLQRELLIGRALYDRSPELGADSVADLLSSLSGRRVTIIARSGAVMGESELREAELARVENHAGRPEVRAALAGRVGTAVRRSATVGTEHLYLAVPTRRGEVLRFSVPLSEIEAALASVHRGIFSAGGGALLLAALFSLGFSMAITRPLRRVGAVARAMAAGDLSRRLRERRSDELGDLADALDALADELQQRLGQLEGERAEMQALIDSMSEGVLALSATGTLRRANPAACRMFSLPRNLRGIPPEAVARRPDFLHLVGRALEGHTVSPTELSSSGRHLLATAQPLPDGGAVLVFLDVTELRRLEGVRRDFVANASHELKTPLTAIRGYSETLLDEDLPPELSRKFAEVVKANAERLQHIVDDLLDLSRIESGGWRIEPEIVSLAEVAREAWAPLDTQAKEKGIRFLIDLAEGSEEVYADSGALCQVLANLFSNALRYTPSGGRIEMRARPVPPAGGAPAPSHNESPRVRIEVRDTGAGIPTAHLSRIFERFYRVDPARSRMEGGTGLGLAIVKHLVEAHGGIVEAESQIGQGTTIHFTVPAAPAA